MNKMEKPSQTPPSLAKILLSLCTEHDDEFNIIDTLHDLYCYKYETEGRRRADIWYWRQVLGSIPKSLFARLIWRLVMLKNYLKIALRNIKRHKGYSFINIFGLAVGMACCIIVLLWMRDEFSYDRFYNNGDRLYRLYQKDRSPTGSIYYNINHPVALAPELESKYTGIEKASRYWARTWGIGMEGNHFNQKVVLVDVAFPDMFDIRFIRGNSKTALSDPFSIVLSETMAMKHFGNEDPLGKTIQVEDWYDAQITGIIQDFPHHSHIEFDCVVPFHLLAEFGYQTDDWGNNNYNTYVLLDKNAETNTVGNGISGVIKEHVQRADVTLHMQPVTDIHLKTPGGGGLITTIYIFSCMAVLILLIACINYMNLTTARSVQRAREIGIRQVVGAKRSQLISQLLGESVFAVFIAILLSIVLVVLLLPALNHLFGKQIHIEFSVNLVLQIVAITLITGVVSGIYPAVAFSSLSTIRVLKGNMSLNKKNSLRRLLVVVQFSLSVFLIIGTITVYRQIDFMQNLDLGYNQEDIISLRLRGEPRRQYHAFKNELMKYPGIVSLTRVNIPPYREYSSYAERSVWWEGLDKEYGIGLNVMGVDADFIDTFGLEMKYGRFFSESHPSGSDNLFVLNERAVQEMDLNSPVGMQMSVGGDNRGTVIGVIRDFHFSSLHNALKPLILRQNWSLGYICIRIRPADINGTIRYIQKTIKTIAPNYSFDFEFLDDQIKEQYQTELSMRSISNIVASLAILISCMGLLGLVSFITEQKTKEIGIRKVIGSTITGIVTLLIQEFMKWILIANVISWPLAYYGVHRWLQNFAYRIDVTIEFFFLSTGISLLVALLTVSYHSIKAARANPVDSLRYE